MFTGIKEILIIVIVLLGLFLVPRLMKRRSTPKTKQQVAANEHRPKTGMLRLALFVSVLWIMLAVILLKPFDGDWIPFLVGGILPVGLFWGGRWVAQGFK
ncbi:hypothetical protein P4B35_01020 [Pontiellaceae bacterium B12227]|nr:hypothetical protein [Pontiellaceae bacterium B12227]